MDSANQLVARYQYRAFGAPLQTSGTLPDLVPYRFMGQEWDQETGLYSFGARTYDPVLCRFHEPDPARQFASPYVFVGNEPVSSGDSDGAVANLMVVPLLYNNTVGPWVSWAWSYPWSVGQDFSFQRGSTVVSGRVGADLRGLRPVRLHGSGTLTRPGTDVSFEGVLELYSRQFRFSASLRNTRELFGLDMPWWMGGERVGLSRYFSVAVEGRGQLRLLGRSTFDFSGSARGGAGIFGSGRIPLQEGRGEFWLDWRSLTLRGQARTRYSYFGLNRPVDTTATVTQEGASVDIVSSGRLDSFINRSYNFSFRGARQGEAALTGTGAGGTEETAVTGGAVVGGGAVTDEVGTDVIAATAVGAEAAGDETLMDVVTAVAMALVFVV